MKDEKVNENIEERDINVLSIISFIASLFLSILGFVLSIISLNQIKVTNEKGKGFAIAALVISSIKMILLIALVVLGVYVASNIEKYIPIIENYVNKIEDKVNDKTDQNTVCSDLSKCVCFGRECTCAACMDDACFFKVPYTCPDTKGLEIY